MPNPVLFQTIDYCPVVIDRQASLQAAIAAMKQANFTAIWVAESSPTGHSQLVGAIFPAPLFEAAFNAHPQTELALDPLIVQGLPSLQASDLTSLEAVLQCFETGQVEWLPLVDEHGSLMGVLNKWELLRVHPPDQSPHQLGQVLADARDGFFIMMLDTPLVWHDGIDKAAALDHVFSHQRLTQVNNAFLAQYGARRQDLLGMTPAQFFAHDLPAGQAAWQRLFDLGVLNELTEERRLDDGTSLWIAGHYTCIYDDEGRILGHFGIQRDVTHYKQMAALLSRQERYLAVVVDIQHKLLAAGQQFGSGSFTDGEQGAEPRSPDDLETGFQNLQSVYQDILGQLGEATGASRVYLIENSHSPSMIQPLVWCAAGIGAEMGSPFAPHRFWREATDPWFETLSAGRAVNVRVSDRPAAEAEALTNQGILATLVLPLRVKGQFWGAIGFDNCWEARRWEESEVALLAAAAAALSLHFENYQVTYTLHQNWHRERLTHQLVERMRQTLQVDDIFETTIRELRTLLGCDRTLIYRFNSDWSGSFVAESVALGWIPLTQIYREAPHLEADMVNSQGCKVQNWQSYAPFEVDTYLQASQGGDYRRGKAYTSVSDVDRAGFAPCYWELLKGIQAKAYLLTPIFLGNQLWGLLGNYQNSSPRPWSADDINLVLHVTTQLGVALQHVELLEQTRQQALELAQAKTAAEAAIQAKTEFLANVSHELRTPLNAILGFSEIMRDELVSPPKIPPEIVAAEHQEYLKIINRNGHHLLNLINNVLEMARLESGQSQLSTQLFDLHELLVDLEVILVKKAGQKGLNFVLELDPRLPQTITADREKLLQVLLNLLNNAVKFTSTGSITLRAKVQSRLSISATTSRLNLVFEVEDTGQGIALEDLGDLFQPFIPVPRPNQGAGLGLAISRRFVNMMGGEIAVSSTVDQGSLFKFNIWAIENSVATAESTAAIAPAAEVKPVNQRPPQYRILIVEAQSQDGYSIKQLLSPLECDLRTATSSREALSLWADWHPHLLLIDWQLSTLEGVSIIHYIHQYAQIQAPHESLPPSPTKAIALLPEMAEATSIDPLTMGFDDSLQLPAKRLDLLQLLIKHLSIPNPSAEQLFSSFVKAQPEQRHLTINLAKSYLMQVPQQWRQQLYQAALTGSDDKLFTLIAQLSGEDALLATILTTLTEQFQFDQIIDLLEADL